MKKIKTINLGAALGETKLLAYVYRSDDKDKRILDLGCHRRCNGVCSPQSHNKKIEIFLNLDYLDKAEDKNEAVMKLLFSTLVHELVHSEKPWRIKMELAREDETIAYTVGYCCLEIAKALLPEIGYEIKKKEQ